MTRPNFTDLNILLDTSSSMSALLPEAEHSIMEFLSGQKKEPGYAEVSYYTFNSNCATINTDMLANRILSSLSLKSTADPVSRTNIITKIESTPLADLHELPTSYAGGMTALLDAIGHTINRMGNRYSLMEEKDRPSKVILVIMTDGHENNSIQFDRDAIAQMIKHQEEVYSWDVLYLGANQDAILEASTFGISSNKALTYSQDKYASTMSYLGSTVSSVRSGSVDVNGDYFGVEARKAVV